MNEQWVLEQLQRQAEPVIKKHKAIARSAGKYIKKIRSQPAAQGAESFFQQYGLNTREGQAIMALAEALPRVPDAETANALIHDYLKGTEWEAYSRQGSNALTRFSSKGMQVASSLLKMGRAVTAVTDPFIRSSLRQAIKMIGTQFVLGSDMESALKRARRLEGEGYIFSYDMLGEGARTDAQAMRYFESYSHALECLKEQEEKECYEKAGISVKLSALHPRYQLLQRDTVLAKLLPRLQELVVLAAEYGVPLTLDAEETARLDISLELFEHVYRDSALKNYEGFGLAVQAYATRASEVITRIESLAKEVGRQVPVRLVKGAYWDAEIKEAQILGLNAYPVFTRKEHTDISYLACTVQLLKSGGHLYPQFATHNAYNVAAVQLLAHKNQPYEFQRLFGMGEQLYAQVVQKSRCRVYAPVGEHKELLPYLIRRLMENGANSSFLRQIASDVPVEEILQPLVAASVNTHITSGQTLPPHLYKPGRMNSMGYDLGNRYTVEALAGEIRAFAKTFWRAAPCVGGKPMGGEERKVHSPCDSEGDALGSIKEIAPEEIGRAVEIASAYHLGWSNTKANARAEIIEKVAELFQKNRMELLALCMREAGKTLSDAIAEVREAEDFCRYYAMQIRQQCSSPVSLPGPTGESNTLHLKGRGVFLCISPWNFPLAIFTGQVIAALAAGNCVLAKPAEQTSLIAHRAVELMHQAGVPVEALHLLIGKGSKIGPMLCKDERIAGVAFTGSTEVAQQINQLLAARKGAIVPLIAETGGQNAMIVDSTALPERVLDDVLLSAFGSAGQRCSALRVLYIQEEMARTFLPMLSGAMAELKLGNTSYLGSDIGPVIDKNAQGELEKHIKRMEKEGELIGRAKLPGNVKINGYFVAPHAFEIKSISQLKKEVFGPILHVIRYPADGLDKVIEEINSTGYGLTLGIASRIQGRFEYIRERVHAGNVYVNRSMIGAVVGVQPFGGQGLSGTGFKAGGPHYLLRFVHEQTFTVNTAAIGGNTELLGGLRPFSGT